METLCGADCGKCPKRTECKGCTATGGSPFGGRCVAAEYIKHGGRAAYQAFKAGLLAEVNELLLAEGLQSTDALYELCGSFVNLEYTLPNGEKVRFLKDENIYLGSQITFADLGICYGVVADTTFILLCRYSVNGSEPELVHFKKR